MDNRLIASDLSFEVLKLRTRRAELGSEALDSTNQRLHTMAGRSICDAFMADRETVPDSYQGEARKFFGRE